MDEISGLLISGGVLLAASFITGNDREQPPSEEGNESEKDSSQNDNNDDDDKFDENLDKELRKQRKRYDAELENILRAHDFAASSAVTAGKKAPQPLIVLGNPFYTSFHKLQDALQTIKIPSVINTNIKQRYLLVQLGQWLLYSSALYDPNAASLPPVPDDSLLFQLLVSSGLVLIPGSAFGNCEPGTFVITRDIQDDALVADVIARFRTVQAILENLHGNKPAVSPSAVTAETEEVEDADDISVSSRTRGRKRSSLGATATTTTTIPGIVGDGDGTAKKKKRQSQV